MIIIFAIVWVAVNGFKTGSVPIAVNIICHAAIVRRKSGSVNSAFIIAAWIADVWVNPVKSHGCTNF